MTSIQRIHTSVETSTFPLISQGPSDVLDPEDIFSDSLNALFDHQPVALTTPSSYYIYTSKHIPTVTDDIHPLTISLRTPETQAANWNLHASAIWMSSLYLADHIDDLHLDEHFKKLPFGEKLRVLELGAAAGLPSILIAKLYNDVLITVSDYHDDLLIKTLIQNVEANEVSDKCRVVPYNWGSSTMDILQDNHGFDVVIAADTLWNPDSHGIFLKTLRLTLKKSPNSQIYLVSGLHTGRYTIQAFLNACEDNFLEVEEVTERISFGSTTRSWNVDRVEAEDERERRKWIICISLKWQPRHLA